MPVWCEVSGVCECMGWCESKVNDYGLEYMRFVNENGKKKYLGALLGAALPRTQSQPEKPDEIAL